MFGQRGTITVHRRPSGRVVDSEIRNALERSVNDRGIRATARSIGLAPTAITKILKPGHRIYSPTLQKLQTWFISPDTRPYTRGNEERRKMALEVLCETLDDNAEARIRAIVQGA